MTTIPANIESIARAAELIRAGEIVVFPTETVYGLGADATNPEAVARIFTAKERPSFDPLIVHISNDASLPELAQTVPAPARDLARRFWPGPLTLVLPRSDRVPDIVTAGLPSVAVRMPDHPVALALIDASGRPLAAPSANRFGRLSPTAAAHVEDQLGDRVPLILDAGPCRVGLESTIVSFAGPEPLLLRPGGISLEDIERAGCEVRPAGKGEGPAAPGRMTRHYSPATSLRVVRSPDDVAESERPKAALLLVHPAAGSAARPEGFARVEVLAPPDRPEAAAARLFATLRDLDAGGFDRIYAVAVPERGLGRAIMDRLRRAQQARSETRPA